MEVGAHVWISDTTGDDAWILAEVATRSPTELKVFNVSNPSITYTRPIVKSTKPTGTGDDEATGIKYDGVELANAKLSAAEKAEGKDDDMITLPHLHEPAILHALSERFDDGKIYTWTGPVLIAVNPFQRLPLYTNDILETYRREGLLRSQGMEDPSKTQLGPHVYAIADLSYRQMMSPQRKSQSVLISGESGAGKTESTKIVMLYLTTLGTAQIGDDGREEKEGDLSVMEKVLQSNPILEAFGNARTLRNDNSSRFGKFIELGFNRGGALLGAKVQTYLLEKVRLGFHASGERNYHIFYQLLRGASDEDKKKFGFHDGDTHGIELANYYHYTGQGGAPSLREFTDEDGLKYTLKAMKSLGWDEAKVDKVLSLVAGLLHLGQVTFEGVENEAGQEIAAITDENDLNVAASLLGVDKVKLKTALTERILITRGEAITIQLAPPKASDSRDALAKTIYGALFLWVVSEVNKSIIWKNDSEVRSSIGVLDIFGFECFAINSFEQLCINFTNEALQQQFNKFIFKMEQAEYEREQIQWDFIEFPDNQDCLDVIQGKPNGILAMLDDECRLGARGNDKNWADRLYKQFIPNKDQTESENTRFSALPIDKSRSIFTIRHFAGPVKYTAVTGFLEKNKDEIPVAAQNLFETADSWLIKDIYSVQKLAIEEQSDKAGKAARAKTVGQQFKEQLTQLMEKVESTEPHYIRCIKPNDSAKPNMLTRRRLTEQLRYGGVLEAVRVARMGFPVRLNHEKFFKTYRMLLPSVPEEKLSWSLDGKDPKALCVRLVDIVLEEGKKDGQVGEKSPSEDGISRTERIRRMQIQPIPMTFPRTDVQLGNSKVFMRKPAHDALEAHRVFHQTAAATAIQAWIRGLQKRVQYLILYDAAETVQRFYRGCKGRERWWKLRRAVAGELLTNTFRMLIVKRRYNRSRKGTILFQGVYRGHATRRLLASIKIQTQVRMRKRRYMFRRLKSAAISLQCRQRRGVAKKVLAALKHEQKDIGKLKQNNEKLKLEMASLKAMLEAQAKGNANRQESERQMKIKEEEILRLEKRIAELEVDLDKERATIKKLEGDLEKERSEISKQKEHITVLTEQNSNLQHQVLVPPSPLSKHIRRETPVSPKLVAPGSPNVRQSSDGDRIDSAKLEEQRKLVIQLERELEKERQTRREADMQLIKLKASMNGIILNDEDAQSLLPSPEKQSNGLLQPELEIPDLYKADDNYGSDLSEASESYTKESVQKQAPSERTLESTPRNLQPRQLVTSPSDYLPMIRRGFAKLTPDGISHHDDKSAVSLGWKHEITSRKEREELLRDEAHRFEMHMKDLYLKLEHGVEITMWQYNKTSDFTADSDGEYRVKGSQIMLKLQRKGELLVQAFLAFNTKGGYLSKALSRRKDNSALDPLSLTEIIEVKAGCDGHDPSKFPTSARVKKGDNKHTNLFLTLKASPTPLASSRFYFMKFKSNAARNELLSTLRAILADLQIYEGISVSMLHSSSNQNEDVHVPLSEVNKFIDFERENYDRLLLMMLQGASDLKEKEDELLMMRNSLEAVIAESREKDRTQANDSKLIMQLSKKLETLLMDNEDLRDQNENLNNRVIRLENMRSRDL